MRTLHVLPSAVLALTLGAFVGACGSGGGGGGDTTLTFSPSTDDTLNSGGVVNGTPGLLTGQFVGIGLAGCIRFGIFPFLDSTDTIVSAKLRLRQVSVSGEPYLLHGDVVVDSVDFGLSLGAGDYAPTVLASSIGTLSGDSTLGIKEVDVTAAVVAAAAANDLTADFQIRFNALVLGPPVDYASFEDSEGGLGTVDGPELIVNYH